MDKRNTSSGFTITSANFEPGTALPEIHTCEGKPFAAGISPALEWTAGPEETRSYAIVFADQSLLEAGNPNYAYHWAIWNIPASTQSLAQGIGGYEQYQARGDILLPSTLGSAEHRQARGLKHFFGPCPSWKHFCTQGASPRVKDFYSFTLYALPENLMDVPPYEPEANENYVDTLNAFFAMRALDRTEIRAHSDAAPNSLPFPCPKE